MNYKIDVMPLAANIKQEKWGILNGLMSGWLWLVIRFVQDVTECVLYQ